MITISKICFIFNLGCVSMWVYTVQVGYPQSPEALDPLELELKMVLNHLICLEMEFTYEPNFYLVCVVSNFF